jgi:hypothetical protein
MKLQPEKFIIIFLTLLWHSMLSAQKHSTFSFELAGSGGFGSFNYEKNIFWRQKLEPILDELASPKKIGNEVDFRVGLSFTPVDPNNGIVLIFPVMLHYHFYKDNHGFDIGLGQTLSMTTKGNFFIRMPFSAGYRFQPLDKNYYLRFSYTPIMSYLLDLQYQHWAGITWGYKLKKHEK